MRRPALPLLLLLVVLAGCGGAAPDTPAAGATPTATPTPPPTPEEAVASTVDEWLTTEDAALACEELATKRVIDLYFGSAQECKARAEAGGSTPEITVGDVRVTGRRATAQVRGSESGDDVVLSGTAEVVRRGGRWKVDLLRADWAHSILIAGAKQSDDGVLTAKGAQPCFARGVRRTSLKEAVALVRITQLPGKPGARIRGLYVNLMRSCPDVLNRYVTEQIVDGLKAKGQAARCLRRDLGTLNGVPLLDLTRAALTGDPDGRFVDFASAIALKCDVR